MLATPRSRIFTAAAALALLAALPAAARCGTPAPAPGPLGVPAAPQRYGPEELRADLREMYERLQASHYDLYARRSKAEYDARFAETLRSFDRPLSRFEAEVAFQKFAAYGRVAHSRVDVDAAEYALFREKGGKILPLAVRLADEKGDAAVYVAENLSGLPAIAPGDRLLAIDGQPVAAVVEKLAAHVSGDTVYLVYAQLEPRFPMLFWLENGERAEFRLRLQRGPGQPFEVTLPARSRLEMQEAQKKVPPVAGLDWDAREARLLDGGIAYLRPGPFYENAPDAANPWDPAVFHQFVDKAFADFRAAGAKALLIDLRQNPGGDDSFSNRMIAHFATRPFRFASDFRIKVSAAATESNRRRLALGGDDPASTSARLAAAYAGRKNGEVVHFDIGETAPLPASGRFAGPVYLLIDRRSYSNTANVAALAQDYGFARILGEETADLATTYGAMEQFQLSRTGIAVGFPKAFILRPSGNTDPRGVVPDVAIPAPLLPSADDPMLTKALELVKQGLR